MMMIMTIAQCDRYTAHAHSSYNIFHFRIQKLAMTLTHMIMTPSLGMIIQMRTSMVLDVLEKWLPIGMVNVVLGLLMVPKLEVSTVCC